MTAALALLGGAIGTLIAVFWLDTLITARRARNDLELARHRRFVDTLARVQR